MFREKYSRFNGISITDIEWHGIKVDKLLQQSQTERFTKCQISSGKVISISESPLEREVNATFWETSSQERKINLGPHYYYRIENCFLNPRHGVVFIDENFLSETNIYTGRKRIFGIKRNKHDNYFDVPLSAFNKARKIDEPVFALCTSPGMNYCHFNLDIASGLIPILDRITAGEIKLLWSGGFSRFHIQILEKLGITEDHIIIEDNLLVQCKAIIKSSSNFHAYKKSLSSAIIPFFNKVKRECLSLDSELNELPEKVILYRSPDTSRRINEWENWSKLAEWSKSNGFKLIDPGSLNIDDQIKIFSRAKVIIAQHGAALTNLAYGNKDLCIVEVMPEKRLTKLFLCLTKLASGKHFIILAKSKRLKLGEDLNSFSYVTPFDEIKEIYNRISSNYLMEN